MIQYRRLSAFILGAWLGSGVLVDVAVTQNFQAVDRFLAQPNSVATSVELNSIGRARERVILRRNAGEENNDIFENWERVELCIGTGLFAVLLFGSRPQKAMLGGAALMLLIVLGQHFFLSPTITDLGRRMADLPEKNPLTAQFWTYHGIYSGSEIGKLLIGLAMGVRLSIRRKPDPDKFAKEYELEMSDAKNG